MTFPPTFPWTLDRAARAGIALGILALLALAAGHLALTDIHRGEGDLTLEWNALRVVGLVLAASQAWALVVFSRIARAPRR